MLGEGYDIGELSGLLVEVPRTTATSNYLLELVAGEKSSGVLWLKT